MRYTAGTDTDPKLVALVESAQDEPVFIERGQREVAVLVSVREYERLRGTATREFLDFCDKIADKAAANGLTEAKLQELLRNA